MNFFVVSSTCQEATIQIKWESVNWATMASERRNQAIALDKQVYDQLRFVKCLDAYLMLFIYEIIKQVGEEGEHGTQWVICVCMAQFRSYCCAFQRHKNFPLAQHAGCHSDSIKDKGLIASC